VELLITARQESGAAASARYPLQDSVTLGRGPESPLLLDATGISREHFKLHLDGSTLLITDLSSNGTWLNTQKLQRGQPQPLTCHDEVKVPGFQIQIEWPEQTRETPKQLAAAQSASNQPATAASAGGSLRFVRKFAGSFSTLEKFLLFLALLTLGAVVVYLTSA
jgi:predicted component of type VI protein secretion system